jgi:hypothetical protein
MSLQECLPRHPPSPKASGIEPVLEKDPLDRVASDLVAEIVERISHAESMPLVGDDVVLLDWAGPRLGSVGVDLGFFIPMSFPAERRAGIERSFVEHHTEVLLDSLSDDARPGIDPWLAYRRGVLRRIARIAGIVHTWDASTLSSLKMIVRRCATAAVELEVGEL